MINDTNVNKKYEIINKPNNNDIKKMVRWLLIINNNDDRYLRKINEKINE